MDYFFKPNNLDTPKNRGDNYFSVPDEDVFDNKMTSDEKKEYVSNHVSGIKYDSSRCVNGGNMLVTFERFKSMVNEGYNIFKAEIVNDELVSIEFQKLIDDGKRMGGR